MTFPIGKNVLIKPDPVKDSYENGLLKATKQKSNSGVVLEMSLDYEFPFKVGDHVYYLNTHQEETEDGILIRGDEDGAILYVIHETV